jgi:WD40 repeat protein
VSAAETSFYVTGGTLRHDAPSYVERQADHAVSEGLLAGEFCYVLTPRQMGKSSLMVRTASKLRERGVSVIALDLTAIGQNLTAEQWYDGLVVRMGRQLRLDEDLERFWRAHERLGPCQRLFMAIRDVVLRQRAGPLAIFVDEVDSVRSLPFSIDEFFAAIRECYNRRAEDAEFNRLTFCLLGVAAPSDLIRDTRTTPFNIGRRIELHDFTRVEAAPLAQGLRGTVTPDDGHSSAPAQGDAAAVILTSGRLLTRILHWTGGHPYLTQRFCRAVAEDVSVVDATGVDRICEDLFLSSRARERDDNLLFVRERLLRSETDLTSLLELYRKVRRGEPVPDDETSRLVSVLRLSGIVASEEGFLRVRNRIYSRVFDEEWIRVHLPDAELRRQRAAFYRGVAQTTAIAAVVVAALTITVVIAISQARKAQLALAESHFSKAKALRVSGLAGQRYESLNALDKARHYHTNVVALRDEALACLALVDLRESTNINTQIPRAGLVELSPDLEVVATAEAAGSITLSSVRDGQLRGRLPGIGMPIERLRFGPTEPVLVGEFRGDPVNQFVVWNWKEGRQLFVAALASSGGAIDFTTDSRKLAIGGADGHVTVFSLPHGEILHRFEMRLDTGDPSVSKSVRFSPCGDRLAVCSLSDQYVEIWNLVLTQRMGRLYHADVVHDVAWHPRGQLLAAACGDARVYLWQTNEMESPKILTGHEGAVTAVAFNDRGTLLASLGNDETVRLWTPASVRQVAGGRAGERFDRLQFSIDERRLIASGGGEPKTRVWDVFGDELTILQVEGGRRNKLRTIDFSPDSRWLLGASSRQATFWDTDSGRDLGAIEIANARGACFGADSRHLLASGERGLFKRQLLYQDDFGLPHIESGVMQQLSWATDGAKTVTRPEWMEVSDRERKKTVLDELGMLAMSRNRKTAAVVHTVTDRRNNPVRSELLLVTLEPAEAMGVQTNRLDVYYPVLALHPNGEWLATWPTDTNALHLWNLSADAGESAPALVPSGEYFSFSQDGAWLATCLTGKFQFYRVGDWKDPAFSFPRMTESSQHAPVAFSWDGRTAALASSRYSIQLIRLPESGRAEPELIATLECPDRLPLEMLAFSPDGRKLAAATDGQIVQLWNLALLRDGLAALNLHRNWPE